MSDNQFPDPISAWNSPPIITLPHQPTPPFPIVAVPTTRTLRDDFAMAALQGFCASIRPDQVWSHDELATTCYRIANAMLKAREVKP